VIAVRDRLEVAHLAQEDHVGVLTQHAPHGLGEGRDVLPDFALGDDRLLVLVVVLDRVFDRDDVPLEVHVDVVDHRRQRGRLAGPRRSGHEQQAPRTVAEVARDLREPDLVEAQQPVRDEAERHARPALLVEDAHAKPRLVAEPVGEVGAALLLELLEVPGRRDLLHQGHGVVGLENGHVDVDEPAVAPDDGRAPHRDVEVGAVLIHDEVEKAVDLEHGHLTWR
jgi:hypothetical protein